MKRRAFLAGLSAAGLAAPAQSWAISSRLRSILFGHNIRTIALQDNFNDNLIDSTIWVQNNIAGTGAGTTVAETSGQLQLTPAASDATPKTDGYLSVNSFDVTGKRVFVKVVGRTESSGATDSVFQLATGTEYVRFRFQGVNNFTCQRKNGGSNVAVTQSVVATTNFWVSLREQGGNFHFEWCPGTSSNPPRQSDWIYIGALSPGSVNPASVKVSLCASNLSSIASPGTAIFDGLNTGT